MLFLILSIVSIFVKEEKELFMLATSYLELDEAFISKALTDAYEGMKTRYTGGK